MRIVKRTITQKRKINIGNYENIDFFIAAEIELHDGTLQEFSEAFVKMSEDIDIKAETWANKHKEDK